MSVVWLLLKGLSPSEKAEIFMNFEYCDDQTSGRLHVDKAEKQMKREEFFGPLQIQLGSRAAHAHNLTSGASGRGLTQESARAAAAASETHAPLPATRRGRR